VQSDGGMGCGEGMSQQFFEVGDIAILVGLITHADKNGDDVTILGAPEWRSVKLYGLDRDKPPELLYPCDWRGLLIWIAPYNLRKRQPPSDSSSWDLIAEITQWQPDQEHA
jgi:hypothetical protein